MALILFLGDARCHVNPSYEKLRKRILVAPAPLPPLPRVKLLAARTTACNFSSLIWPAGSAPSLFSTLQSHKSFGKTQCFATFHAHCEKISDRGADPDYRNTARREDAVFSEPPGVRTADFCFFLLLRQTISHDDFLFAIALWYYFIVLRW